MKASLMIGDWVCYSKANNYYTRVNEIRHTEAPLDDQWYIEGMRSDNDKINPNAVEYFAVEILSPIPLTAEILEENGFEKRDGRYQDVFYSYGVLDLRIDSRFEPCGYTLYGVYELPIKYVHELQHALRLCGIDKEIEI